jgi:predicted Zn-dependent protease
MTDVQGGQAPARAFYFDGTSSRKHRVGLRISQGLDIIENGAVIANWPFDSVRRVNGPPKRLRLSSVAASPLARLDVEGDAPIAALMPYFTALDVDRGGPRQTWRIIVWSTAAICSILGVTIYGIPLAADRLAPLIPNAVERRIGGAVDAQVRAAFGGRVCTDPQGNAAFAALIEKIRVAGGMTRPLQAGVLATSVENAFALPGGKVYLLNGLLQKAKSPDELAGILAHELGHVHHLHTMRLLIQTGGTSFLVGLLLGDVAGGGAVIFAARSVLNASYSREREQEADDFAAAAMDKLGRSPVPMAELLLRITGEEGKRLRGFTILNSHPLSEERLAIMRKRARGATGPELLSAAQWAALRTICRNR